MTVDGIDEKNKRSNYNKQNKKQNIWKKPQDMEEGNWRPGNGPKNIFKKGTQTFLKILKCVQKGFKKVIKTIMFIPNPIIEIEFLEIRKLKKEGGFGWALQNGLLSFRRPQLQWNSRTTMCLWPCLDFIKTKYDFGEIEQYLLVH